MADTIQQTNWYTPGFELFEKSLNGERQSQVHEMRRSAFSEFSRLGFPTTRNEEWRFTNVSPIAKTNFKVCFKHELPGIEKKDIEQFLMPSTNAHTLVFMNGHFSSELSSLQSLPAGVRVENLALAIQNNEPTVVQYLGKNAVYAENAFNALNTAFIQDGIFISLDDGVIFETPIQCLYIASSDSTPFIVQPRNLIIAGKNSRVSIIERYVSLKDTTYCTNVVTEVILAEDAAVEHTKLQTESENAYHISTIHARQQARSRFTSHSIALGGSLVRNNIIATLNGEFTETTLNGLSLGTGKQLVDNHTTIDHAMPNCVSHELYKSILDGEARGVFNGKIFVRKDAQKTDAKQTNKTLLLSEDATIDTKPQLEIFADDVKCTHGATVGQLDENQIFYLRTRGFGKDLARDVLTTAFANDVVDRIPHEALRERLYTLIFQQLHEGRMEA